MLADAAENQCTNYICIGDIVGYNANPRECLDIVRNMNCPTVKGNHDEDSSSYDDLEGLNPLAVQALMWTREQLDEDDKKWLRDLKFVRQVRDFTIVHATLDSPGSWAYVMNKFDAMASFSYQFSSVCFHGHTHVPKAYVKDEGVRAVTEPNLKIEPGRKYFINVGSVGQPRDGDWRASYAIYDVDEKVVATRRLEYDIGLAQKKIIAAGLPQQLADRLGFGK